MAIRSLKYTVNINDITPAAEQLAGIQGEHRVTEVVFAISDALYSAVIDAAENGKVLYRFDVYDGEGGVWSSDAVELSSTNVSIEIEERHTRAGGEITVYLVITALSKDNNTEMELYSFPAVLKLKNRPDGIAQDGENYESMSGLAEVTKQNTIFAAEEAKKAELSARAAADALASFDENITNCIDQTYNSISEKAQSGKAVAEAVSGRVPKPTIMKDAPVKTVIAMAHNDYTTTTNPDTTETHIANDSAFQDIVVDDGNVFSKENVRDANRCLVMRDGVGNLWTGTPVDNQDCVPKKYVDEAIANIENTGGSGGTTDYAELNNKPKINGVELLGNKTTSDLGIEIPAIDQTYNPESENAQSGVAVAEAIAEVIESGFAKYTPLTIPGTITAGKDNPPTDIYTIESMEMVDSYAGSIPYIYLSGGYTLIALKNNITLEEIIGYGYEVGCKYRMAFDGNVLSSTELVTSSIEGGFSPVIEITETEQGHDVSITDVNGTQTFSMLNGEDGTSATHSWNGTVLTITSASGTSSADLKGEKGDNGKDTIIDLTYSNLSENAQSGKALSQIVEHKANMELKEVSIPAYWTVNGEGIDLTEETKYAGVYTASVNTGVSLEFTNDNGDWVFDLQGVEQDAASNFEIDLQNAGLEVGKKYYCEFAPGGYNGYTQIKIYTFVDLVDKADKEYVDALVGDIASLLGGI